MKQSDFARGIIAARATEKRRREKREAAIAAARKLAADSIKQEQNSAEKAKDTSE